MFDLASNSDGVNTLAPGIIGLAPGQDDALRHVDWLTGSPDTEVCLRFIHDSDRANLAANRDGSISNLWPGIIERQAEGYGVFVVVNEGGHNGRSITNIRALHIDGDDIPLPSQWHVGPDFIVKRNATHWHAYWPVADMAVTEFKTAQKRLIAMYGSDGAIHDLPRIMRLAGSLHLKDPTNPQRLTIERMTDAWQHVRGAAELTKGLPEIGAFYEAKPRSAPVGGAAELVEGLPEIGEAKPRSAPVGFIPDQPWNVDRAIRYLKVLPEIVENHGADDATYAVARVMRALGLSEEKAIELMKGEHFKLSPQRPETPAFVIEKVENAYVYSKNEWGCDAFTSPPSEVFDKIIEKINAEAKAEENAGTPRDLVTMFLGRKPSVGAKLPDLVFWDAEKTLIRSPQGSVTVVYGPSGGHKTTLILRDAFDACISGAHVLYCAGEGSHGIERYRIPELCKAADMKIEALDDNWRTAPLVPLLTNAEHVEAVMTAAKQFKADIIVLDTFAAASGGIDENSSQFGALLTSTGPVGRLARETGANVVVIHHSGKDLEKGSRGHSSISGNSDAVFRVTADKDARTVKKIVEKMRDGQDNFAIGYNLTPEGRAPVATKTGRIKWKPKKADADAEARALVGRALFEANAFTEQRGLEGRELAERIEGSAPEKTDEDSVQWGAWNERVKKRVEWLKKRVVNNDVNGPLASYRHHVHQFGTDDKKSMPKWFLNREQRAAEEANAAVRLNDDGPEYSDIDDPEAGAF
jgi:hypothetical protein